MGNTVVKETDMGCVLTGFMVWIILVFEPEAYHNFPELKRKWTPQSEPDVCSLSLTVWWLRLNNHTEPSCVIYKTEIIKIVLFTSKEYYEE